MAHTQGKCSFCKQWQYMDDPKKAVTMPQHRDPQTNRNCFGMKKGPIKTR